MDGSLKPNSIRYLGRDQLSSRPASKQDSVMEYGMNRSATRFELSRHVEIARTCLRVRQVGKQVCDQVCDLDSVMEFVKFHYAI